MTWPMPIIFTSWGFRHQGDRWNTGQELADWCNSCHIRSVAVQLGNDHEGFVNTELADIEPLRDAGVHVLVWGIAEPDYVRRELDRLQVPEGDWFPQIENDGERDKVYRQIEAGIETPGIVTTYGGASNPEDVKRLQDAGVHQVHVECYSEAGYPHTDLNRMLWQGTQYGWSENDLYACLGTYRGEMPDAYTNLYVVDRGYSLYLAEPMSGDQWVAFGELAVSPPPRPPEPEPEPEPEPPDQGGDMEQVTDQQARDGVLFAIQAARQNWDAEKPKGRLTVAGRIVQAANSDDKWNKAREEIVPILDKYGIPQLPE